MNMQLRKSCFRPVSTASFSKVVTMTRPDGVYAPVAPISVGKIIVQENGESKWGWTSGVLGAHPEDGTLVSDEAAS